MNAAEVAEMEAIINMLTEAEQLELAQIVLKYLELRGRRDVIAWMEWPPSGRPN